MLICFQCKNKIVECDYQTVSVVGDMTDLEIFKATEYHFHSKCVALVLLQYIAYVLEYEQHIETLAENSRTAIGNA